jgi:hypothetical protein
VRGEKTRAVRGVQKDLREGRYYQGVT